MSFQRQDYILRLIRELGQMVSAAVASGDPGKEAQALHGVMHAQQQLFNQTAQDILSLTLDEQIEVLSRGESPDAAVEKIATYAAILEQAARVYANTNRPLLATNSRLLSLSALLTTVVRWPDQRGIVEQSIDDLTNKLEEGDLTPPVRELLEHYAAVV